MGNQSHFYTKMRQLVYIILPILFIIVNGEVEEVKRKEKLLPFQIIKFPNNPCYVSGATKNGTCYTAEECETKGGTSAGSCAEGYGVCCTFTIGCGESSSENLTYVSVSNGITGPCTMDVCKCNTNICSIRLDFETFVITGPATVTTTVGKLLNGLFGAGGAGKASLATRCLTDTFSVSHRGSDVLCGTLTNEHIYVDVVTMCHSLNFYFGSSATGISTLATRSVSIKATQFNCGDTNIPPRGCTQWFYGNSGAGTIKSLGFDGSVNHLADQHQSICIRREQGYCKICYYASAVTDVMLGGKSTKPILKDSSCCGFGSKGTATAGGYDCIMIPGAKKTKTTGTALKPSFCGAKGGIATSSATSKTATICSSLTPFRIEFHSDSYEMSNASTDEATVGLGFKIKYYQTSC